MPVYRDRTRSMVGCASMALWRHGDDDGEIEIFRREAGIDAASAMSEWFGIAAIEATTGLGASVEPHPLEGIAEATTPGLPDISIVTAEEAAVAFERAERQDRFSGIRKIDGPDPADELGYTDPMKTPISSGSRSGTAAIWSSSSRSSRRPPSIST